MLQKFFSWVNPQKLRCFFHAACDESSGTLSRVTSSFTGKQPKEAITTNRSRLASSECSSFWKTCSRINYFPLSSEAIDPQKFQWINKQRESSSNCDR
jgi:hypothetical protein